MASTSQPPYRASAYSLSNDQHTPEWLCEPPLCFDDVLRPPSYLFASLQQALHDCPFDPPAYEHTEGPVAGPSTPAPTHLADEHDSIWEDWDEDEEGADDADDERADADADEVGSLAETETQTEHEQDLDGRDSDGGSTLLDVPLPRPRRLPLPPHLADVDVDRPPLHHVQQYDPDQKGSPSHSRSLPPTPTPPPTSPSPPQQPAPAPSPSPSPDADDAATDVDVPLPYHLLHLHHLMEKVAKCGADPHDGLSACLATLDAPLLATPFTCFAELCYEHAVRGDDSPPNPRPFSPLPRPKAIHIREGERRKSSRKSKLAEKEKQPVASGSGSGSGSSRSRSSSEHALAHALANENVDNMDFCATCPTLEQDPHLNEDADDYEDYEDEEDEEEEEEEPHSPAPTPAFTPPPLVYDARADEAHRMRYGHGSHAGHGHGHELTLADGVRCLSPVSMSLLLGPEDPTGVNGSGSERDAYRCARQPSDPAAEVACLFLHTPVPTSAGAAVQFFPTRPVPSARERAGGVRGLFRSLNLNRA